MNPIKLALLILLFQFLLLEMYSQSPHCKIITLEYKHNINQTKHLNSPVEIDTYLEGGRILEQNAKWVNTNGFYLNLRNHKFNEYRIGIGLTKIRFDQVREDWTGIGPEFVEVINETVQYNFVHLLIGFRKYINPESRLKPFGGLSIIGDRNLEDDYQVKFGASIEAEIGLEHRITEKMYVSISLNYRNAILSYNQNKNYYPNLWGIGTSLRYQLNTHHNKP